MGFYALGSVSFVFSVALAVIGVLFSNVKPALSVYVIYVSAIMSLPGFIVIWDFVFYRIIWLFPWS